MPEFPSENEEEILLAWTMEQERIVDEAGGTPEAQIDFELRRAKRYEADGQIEDALDALYDALIIATNQMPERCSEIETLMTALT